MRVSYRTPRHAGIPRLMFALGLVMTVSIGLIINLQAVYQYVIRRISDADENGVVAAEPPPFLTDELMILLSWTLILLVIGLLAWPILPPSGRYGVAIDATALRVTVDGTSVSAPWESVESLRLDYLPAPRRPLTLDQRTAWHLIVTATGYPSPLAVPLHTFHADVDDITEAIMRYVPESVHLEVGGEDPYGVAASAMGAQPAPTPAETPAGPPAEPPADTVEK